MQEPEVERTEDEDDSDIGRETLPDVASEEQDVHRNYDGCHRDHVKGADYRPPSH